MGPPTVKWGATNLGGPYLPLLGMPKRIPISRAPEKYKVAAKVYKFVHEFFLFIIGSYMNFLTSIKF